MEVRELERESRTMSYFLPEKGALFLHIPRTGGTFIGHSMVLIGLKVDNWGKVCELYRPIKHTILPHIRPDLLERIKYIFSFVRHPVKHYVSVWRFVTRSVSKNPEVMRNILKEGRNLLSISEGVNRWKPDFNEWMEEMLEKEPGWMTRYIERYVGPDKGEFPHFIGRLETIEQDMERVMQIIGYEKEWEESKSVRNGIVYARNQVGTGRVPNIEMDQVLQERVERSERVLLRRFYGEETSKKRIYRNLEGMPV